MSSHLMKDVVRATQRWVRDQQYWCNAFDCEFVKPKQVLCQPGAYPGEFEFADVETVRLQFVEDWVWIVDLRSFDVMSASEWARNQRARMEFGRHVA